MKWLVKTLDSLLPYATEDEAVTEQKNLEALIARYKNLIPTIEITMVKTEVFSKSYTYRREVHEVVCLLNKVKDQTANAPAPESLERLNRMIQEQQFAINQLDHQRTHIMSMLQRGRDLSKDVHAPPFVTAEVKNLESGWNDAYHETVDKLRALKGTQTIWDDFQKQKDHIISLLHSAETELRSITPLQTDPRNVSSDLKHKRELNVQLQQASRQMIANLHDLCHELTPLADPTKKPLIEKEVTELEKQFFNTMEHVKDRVNYLEDYSNRWSNYKARLAELHAWALQQAPQLIEAVQSQELSPEERVVKADALQGVISDKMRQLDILASDAFELAPKEGNAAEAKRLRAEVSKLQEVLSVINRKVDHQGQAVKEDLINWQQYQAGIQDIKPWIEECETKVSLITNKPSSLQQAVQMQANAKQFETQCEYQLEKLHSVASISNLMSCKTNAPDELDAVQSRWTSVHDNAKQITNKFDRLVTGWQSFDGDATKVEDWLDNSERVIAKRPDLLNTPHVDKLEKELVKLKSFNNEISEQQAKIVSLQQSSDQLALGLAPEGVATVKDRVNAMKGKITKLSESVRAKINDVSDAIMSRQDFNAQLANFSNWMDQMRGQVAHVEDIYSERVEPSLHTVHSLLQQHSEKNPAFNAIYEEVKNLTSSSTPQESSAINDSYTALVLNYQDIENNLQQKKDSLEKWNEFLGWRNESESHANHIKQQLDQSDKLGPAILTNIVEEIEETLKTVTHWKAQAKIIDNNPVVHLKDSATGKPLSAIQVVNDLENKLENLKLKSQSRVATLNKMEDRKRKFNQIENELGEKLAANRGKLSEILQQLPNNANVDQIVANLVTLNDNLQTQIPLKERVHDEGAQLMRDDITIMPAVQESMLVLDKSWDDLQQEITDRTHKYTLISQGLKDYAIAKNRFGTEIKKAHTIYLSVPQEPSGEQQLLQTADKTKKALEQIKKSKAALDDFERKGGTLLKLFESIDNTTPNEITPELKQSHDEWQKLHDQISKHAHLYETEAVIWNQIEDLKNDLVPWLEETIQSLNDAADNSIEIEYGPIRLNKYRAELPAYASIRDDIIEKIGELTKINNDVKIPSLIELENLLAKQFAVIEDSAQNLEQVASSFEEQEKDLRKEVKSCGESINKLREALIKCDDMSGDNSKIIERLRTCQALKAQLTGQESKLDNLKARVDEMKFTYPTFAESIIPKELSNVQKRLDVVATHANKIEASLLQFLKKFHTDKLGMLKRLINVQKEKIAWCVPEPSSDKYNLAVKQSSLNDVLKGILDCEARKNEIEESVTQLDKVDSPESLNALKREIAEMNDDLKELKMNYDKTKVILDNNSDLWQQYETISDGVTTWLKDIEVKVKTDNASQVNLQNADNKIQELKEYQQQTSEQKPILQELEKISKAIVSLNSDSRVLQVVNHLATRHQAVAKNIVAVIDRINGMKGTLDNYNKNKLACEEWLQSAKIQFNDLARMGSPGAGPSSEQLDLVKAFVNELGTGQNYLNAAEESAETLYSVVTPDNREKIRNEVRQLRENFDNIHDEAKSLLTQVESVLIQKTSIEESYSQVRQWLSESKSKVGDQGTLYATLAEKKAALQKFKAQLLDNNLHKGALKQLQDKAQSLSDEEAEHKVSNSIQEYDNLSKNLNERIAVCENHVVNHEAFDQILEKAQDWLKALKAEAVDVFNDSAFEKDGADEKLTLVENIIAQKPEGEKIFDTCRKQLETVLLQTHPSGHPALINSFEGQKQSWDTFIGQCQVTEQKLKQLCSQWNEFDAIAERIDNWLKQTENVVKDQSLKSTCEAKQAHLDKLKRINAEITAKAPEIATILEQSHGIEGENDINLRVSRINTRYQTLKNLCKENVGRYENYTKEHAAFNDDYGKFKNQLQALIDELQANSEIVGDLSILQERQNKIREISDRRIQDASIFESLIDRGEKLYIHTSPDGREIIRQQLRSLRTNWDNFSDDLNTATQKSEQCLLQFGDFTVGQEQLTKWLKEVEKSMQSHTELKNTLQEKRAQLQNHKLMHQDILGHNTLVDSVCDKAQLLVDQTQDESLNVYLQSIKQLFADIVEKSQFLLSNLEGCVQMHNNYIVQCASLRSWLNGEKQKLLECDDLAGEKTDISRKLNALEQLKKNKDHGQKLFDDLSRLAQNVQKSTAVKGVELIAKEMGDLKNEFDNHFVEIVGIEDKQNNVLNQWNAFEKNLDELTKWCRSAETIFRDQQLQSTIQEKEKQLDTFKDQRENILQSQKKIDEFVDQAQILLNNSGADRIKTLVSQLTNRYQLLQVLSKEVVNRWQALVDDHRKYSDKLDEVNAWILPVEQQLDIASNEEPNDGTSSNLLPLLLNEQEQAEKLLSAVNALGEKALPETSTQGREKIRQELRDIRDRWDKIDEGIRKLQKRQEAQSIQWSSYQDILQQTLSWLDTLEKLLEQENPNTWTSTQEIRSKLFKHKTTLQDINSHKRIIEAVNDKASALLQNNVASNADEIKAIINSINSRYENLGQNCKKLIGQLEDAIDVYQQFSDMQKVQQDYQKNLWDRLTGYSDYSGNKTSLQARLQKVNEIQDSLSEGVNKLHELSEHVDKKTTIIPSRCKEAMARDLTNLKVDFDKFNSTLNDVKAALEHRLQQWNDYETNLDRLITWLTEAENSLKNYAPRNTLEEKQEQLNKFQVNFTSNFLVVVLLIRTHTQNACCSNNNTTCHVTLLKRNTPLNECNMRIKHELRVRKMAIK